LAIETHEIKREAIRLDVRGFSFFSAIKEKTWYIWLNQEVKSEGSKYLLYQGKKKIVLGFFKKETG